MPRIRFAMLVTVLIVMSSALLCADRDEGQYLILSAQYGTRDRHIDVTDRLRELARTDRPFRVSNGTLGVDPDRGRPKALRIFARGPRGEERMFEYREGSTVDGADFRGWRRGEWGRGGWSGNWEGGGAVSQPHMQAALDSLRTARQHLADATPNKGGHRLRAMELIDQAMSEVQQGIDYDNTH